MSNSVNIWCTDFGQVFVKDVKILGYETRKDICDCNRFIERKTDIPIYGKITLKNGQEFCDPEALCAKAEEIWKEGKNVTQWSSDEI